MRVLETEATSSYNMGKNRKHKLRKTKEASESSDDGTPTIPVCNHINMAVNMAAMKKGLAKQMFGECMSCSVKRSERHGELAGEQASAAQSEDNHINLLGDGETTLWVCLQCGNQGCDRNSREKHALKHFETPRSSCHCLVINTSSWTCWCYKCDDDVPAERSKRIQECLEYLRKQAGLSNPDTGKRSTQGAAAAISTTDQIVRDANTRPMSARTATGGFCHKIKGLSNLGNTCFFNAVLQNLTQTQCLESQLVERGKKGKGLAIQNKHFSDSDDSSGDESDSELTTSKDLRTIEINLGEAGPLTQSLLNFLQEMNNNTTARTSTVNPNALFNQVCKKAQRFRGFQQQDSHELLRYLLDNMKTEEIKRRQGGILKFFKLSENVNPKKVDEETKLKVKEYGKQIRHTFVDTVFGGHLISTVICEECKFISQIFEPFLDLSLPVTEEKPQRPNQVQGGRKKEELETQEEPQAMGVDGFAYKPEKPSKHQDRKQKRQAKKDAKKKNKIAKNQISPVSGGEVGVHDEETQKERTSSSGGEVQDEKKDLQKEVADEEGNSSNRDDPSDADVEDNLESDTSRMNRFAVLSASFESEKQHGGQNSLEESRVHLSNQDTRANGEDGGNGTDQELIGERLANRGLSAHHSNNERGITEENHTVAGDASTLSRTICKESVEIEKTLWNGSTNTLRNGESSTPSSTTYKESVEKENMSIGSSTSTLRNGELSTSSSTTYKDSVEQENMSLSGSANTLRNGELSASSSTTCKESIESENTSLSGSTSTLRNGVAGLDNSVSNTSETNASKSNSKEDINQTVQYKEDCMKSMYKSEEKVCNGIEIVRKSLSDTRIVDVSSSNGSQQYLHYCKNTSCNDCVCSDKIQKLKIACDQDVQEQDFSTSNHNDGTPLLKSKSAENVGASCENAERNSSKLVSSGSIKRSSPPLIRQSSKSNSKNRKELRKDAQVKSTITLGPRYHPSSRECTIMSCLHQFTSAELLTGNNKFGCANCTKLKHKQNPNKEKKETVYSNASKQYLIFVPPAVLTLHMKRFEQVGFSSRKVHRHVDFPFVLDLAPYCSSLCQGIKPGQHRVLYALYGVVEHSGKLNTGHYTAYVKVRPNIGLASSFLASGFPSQKEYIRRYMENLGNAVTPENEESDEMMEEKLVPPGRWYHISDSRVSEVTDSTVQRAQAYLLFYERIY